MVRSSIIATALLLGHLSLVFAVAQTKCLTPEATNDPKFSPGQVWSYRTRSQGTDSTITILRIEKTPKLGTIIHIRIDNLHWKGCRGGVSPTMQEHTSFTRAALERSVLQQAGTAKPLPDFAAGYQDWRAHCGGAYTLSVAEVMALNDAQFNATQGC